MFNHYGGTAFVILQEKKKGKDKDKEEEEEKKRIGGWGGEENKGCGSRRS